MKKYLSFFRIRFTAGLQYRTAALAGITTQFAWGFLSILLYAAFYRTDPGAVPMEFEQLATYMWLRQGLLALFTSFVMDVELFRSVVSGQVAYDLCRPAELYGMWFIRNAALRLSSCVLRCFPIFIVAALIPGDMRLCPPAGWDAFALFLLSVLLGFGVTLAFSILIYLSAFYTLSPEGVRIIAASAVDFFSGAVIPLNFLPERVRIVCELLPFSGMQNVPLRVYSGNIAGREALFHLSLQAFWLVVLVCYGRWLASRATRRVVVQGG